MTGLIGLLAAFPGFERELRILPMLLRPGHVCVDVGASLGVYSIPMALLVGATGVVLAFEPRQRAARRLRRVARLLRLDTLQVESAALGLCPRSSTLVVPRRSREVPGRAYLTDGAVCHALEDGLTPGATAPVQVTTLAAVRERLGRRIHFVKCDVEGTEHDVFTGGADVLEHDRPVVLCETENRHARRYGRSSRDLFELFAGHHYQPVAAIGDHHEHRNVIFVPSERIDGVQRALGT